MTVRAMPSLRVAMLPILALVLVVAGCGGSAVAGNQPLASLDPNSPKLAAQDITFDTAVLTVPANRPFTLVFENRENVPHNVSIYADSAHRDRRFEGAVFSGPATHWYPVPALAPGTYTFVCDVHPIMTGSLVAS
jgi:plastocyanin